MKIKILGCGNAFSTLNFNLSFLIEEDSRKLLIDAGYQTQAALQNVGLNAKDIDDIYISHQHADHIGCLEWFAFMRYDWATQPRPQHVRNFKVGDAPTLYCEKGLVKSLWESSLRGGLESMEGFMANINTFFNVKGLDADKGFKWQGWNVKLVQQIHIMAGSKILPTYGIIFSKKDGPQIYITTDAQHCSPAQVEVFYKQSDFIFQDCELNPFLSNVHANYIQLAGMPEANARILSKSIKEKMYLVHYQDMYNQKKKMVTKGNSYPFYEMDEGLEGFSTMEDFDWDESAKVNGLGGFVKLGQFYDF